MKGASAEPLVRINIPPNTSIMANTGSSQYFLRCEMYRKNSCKKLIAKSLELLPHRFAGSAGVGSRQPVGEHVTLLSKGNTVSN
jgi:hypothetical protein